MISLTFCHPCTKTLYEYGAPAICLFEQICLCYLREGALEIAEEDDELLKDMTFNQTFTILKFLEEKGFIVSTESTENRIIIRPKGITVEENWSVVKQNVVQDTQCHFCLKGYLH